MRKASNNPIFNLLFFLISISSYTQQATEESNAILLKQVKENNKRLEILRREDSLQKILIEQSGDINSATSISPKSDALNDEYEQIANTDLNQEMSQQAKAENADEVNRNTLSKLIDSIPPVILYIFWSAIAVITIKLLFGKKKK